jgi:hypothetical protein
VGQGGLGVVEGGWHTGAPLPGRLGERLQVGFTRDGTIDHYIRHAIGEMQLVYMGAYHLANVSGLTAVAPERLHQDGKTRLMLDDQRQHAVVEVRMMIPMVPSGEVDDLFRGSSSLWSRPSTCKPVRSRGAKQGTSPKRCAAVTALRL